MGYVENLREIVGTRPLILTGAVAIIVNTEGQILLQQRRYPKEVWGLPGGLMELGESIKDTACREVFEETGLKIYAPKLLNVYSIKDDLKIAENGDQYYVVTVAFYTNQFEGDVTVDLNEAFTCQFFRLNELPKSILSIHKMAIEEYIEKHVSK